MGPDSLIDHHKFEQRPRPDLSLDLSTYYLVPQEYSRALNLRHPVLPG